MKEIPTQDFYLKKYGTLPKLIMPIKGFRQRQIWSGEKHEEYREIKPYWEKRLEKVRGFNDFPIGLRAGYSPNSPFIACRCTLKKGEGFEKWGAENGKKYYIFKILKVYDSDFWN